MKPKSEAASMITPSKVDTAPCSTGTNICETDRVTRTDRVPIAVRNPTIMCTVNSAPIPIEAISITTGTALKLIPIKPITPNNPVVDSVRMRTTKNAASGFISRNVIIKNSIPRAAVNDISK